jgi:hypothetical protein
MNMKRFVVEQTGMVQREVSDHFTQESTEQQSPPPQTEAIKVSSRKLRSLYGSHAESVLEEYLDKLPKECRKMQTYRILKPLPTNEKYEELQRRRFTSSVSDLVDCAFNCFEDLATEVGDWYDNLPESLQSGDKGCALEEAGSTLENLLQPDVGEGIGAIQVYHLPIYGTGSRPSRRDEAVGSLQAVVEALGAVENKDDDQLRELIDELENAICEAEGVEFPGMY